MNNEKIMFVRKDLFRIKQKTDLYAEIVALRLFLDGIIFLLIINSSTISPTKKFSLEPNKNNPLTNLMLECRQTYESPFFNVQSLVGRMSIFNCKNDVKKIITTSMYPITDEGMM